MRLPQILLLLFCAALSLAPAARAADDFDAMVAGWELTLDELEDRVAAGELDEERFQEVRDTLLAIIEQARAAAATANGTAGVTQQMIEALGPAPAEGEPAEPEVIASERKRLSDSISLYTARARQAELAATRADILLRTANRKRMLDFTEALFRQGALPLSPATWGEIPQQLVYLHDLLFDADAAKDRPRIDLEMRVLLLVAGVVAFGVGIPLRRWLRRRYGPRPAVAEPTYRERVLAAVVEAVVRGLMPAIATILLLFAFFALMEDHRYAGVLKPIGEALAGGLVFFFFCAGLGRAICAPDHPQWRVAPILDANASRLAHRIAVLAATLGTVGAVVAILDGILVPPEIFAVVFFVLVLLTALALAALLPGTLWRQPREAPGAVAAAPFGAPVVEAPAPAPAGGAPPSDGAPPLEGEAPSEKGAWPRVRALAFLVALGAVVASGLGYHNLARYVGQLFFAGLATAGFVLLLRGVIREAVELFVTARTGRVALWRRTLFPREKGLRFFQYVMMALLDICLFFAWILLLLPVSGIAWTEVQTWLGFVMDGIPIGGITLKPVDILLAILTFMLALTITRFLQRRLDDRVLSKLQIDRGVQNSITTGVGYVGVIIAILIGIGTLGLDLSNLALIAGALSVGIGFGLQNVVQNFVAGLILLVERPIKVGDWVVVGDQQGIVKRISVRATEIQTFQRAAVIVPNADLVSRAVLNWTHKDKVGRVDVRLNVDYETDVPLLRETLLEIAREAKGALRYPAPAVSLTNFGPNALEFLLMVHVPEIDNTGDIASELRYRILERFAERGIKLNYSQPVTNVPQLNGLVEALAAQRDAGRAEAKGGS